ncbi:MAG: hypothetical protein K6T92_00880 [Candidatus Rokubacteria bacterium]|nr:hypothetical protein [Candidatus Rokubacteria bacterium]
MGRAHAPPRALSRPVVLLWTGGLAFFLSFYLLLSALPLYARQAGIPDRGLGLIIGAFAFASMLVKPWAGWAADRCADVILDLLRDRRCSEVPLPAGRCFGAR